MSKHTPGPWRVIFTNRDPQLPAGITYRPSTVVIGKREIRIADGVEADADARLIAAAPELLAALELYVAVCGNTAACVSRESAAELYDIAAAAIAKARGES